MQFLYIYIANIMRDFAESWRIFSGWIIAIIIVAIALIYRLLTGNVMIHGGLQSSHIQSQCKHTLSNGAIPTEEMAARNEPVAPFSRILAEDAPELEYRSDPARLRLQLHNGQRKLLLSEIEFLTLHGSLAKDVVYAGSAPGHHITLLANMFPKHRFHLYDPRKFAVKASARVHLHRQLYTDNDAAKWTSKPHLFISDIRNTAEYKRGMAGADVDKHEAEIAKDMEMQRRWVEISQPRMSMLKFRLSWKQPSQEYFDGEIRIQPWAFKSSTETRLITDGKTTRTWNSQKYEKQMFRHNAVTRISYYDIDSAIVSNVPGMDHCYDCRSEVEILTNWAIAARKPHDAANIVKYINDVTDNTQTLQHSPHGLFPDIQNINERERAICSSG